MSSRWTTIPHWKHTKKSWTQSCLCGSCKSRCHPPRWRTRARWQAHTKTPSPSDNARHQQCTHNDTSLLNATGLASQGCTYHLPLKVDDDVMYPHYFSFCQIVIERVISSDHQIRSGPGNTTEASGDGRFKINMTVTLAGLIAFSHEF